MYTFNMEQHKKTIQIITTMVFILGIISFLLYAFNQMQLNKVSKIIIDENNQILVKVIDEYKNSVKSLEKIDSLKFEEVKKTELTKSLDDYNPIIDQTKNLLKPGVNFPSQNNYKLAVTKLETLKGISTELKKILDIKFCFKKNYGEYSKVLTSISEIQDQVSKANSYGESRTLFEKLKAAYTDLNIKSLEVEKCLNTPEFEDLKKNIIESVSADKESVENYQKNYLDPIMALYVEEDGTKIGEFIDKNSTVSVSLKLPSLFNNSTELSIVDEVIEDEVKSQVAKI